MDPKPFSSTPLCLELTDETDESSILLETHDDPKVVQTQTSTTRLVADQEQGTDSSHNLEHSLWSLSSPWDSPDSVESV